MARLARSVALAVVAAACSSTTSTLVTVRSASGSGPVELQLQNNSDVAINNVYLARTDAVRSADRSHLEPGSAEEVRVWGEDLIDRAALEQGGRVSIPVPEPGRWDVRLTDRYDRYQHISGLNLGAGGQYLLKVEEGGWRIQR